MDGTRVDTKKLQQVVEKSITDLDEIEQRLTKLMDLCTPEERKRYLKARPEVIAAAGDLADRSARHPGIVAATNYDAEAVKEDCANLKIIEPLEVKLEAVQKRIADARLVWGAEVMVPTLDFYAASKRPAKDDAELALTIKPLKELLSTPRELKRK